MEKRHFKYISIIVMSMMLCISCNKGKKAENEETEVLPDDIVELREDQIALAGVEFGSIELHSLSGTLKVNGIITAPPQNLASVCLPMGGYVKNASLLPGNAVKKGQVLAVFENQDFVDIQQNYLEAKNKFAYAEAEYNRHTELYKNDVYSQKNLQQVTTEYKNLKAQLRALAQKLALLGINADKLTEDGISSTISLVSPISGFIKTVSLNIGKYVSPSDVLFEIVNSERLLLELSLFEKDADKVMVGQKIRFFINNESEMHEAVIYQTGKSINEDKSYRVYATVSSDCKNILPGMYVNATIETSGNKVPSVPDASIVSFDDKDYIFVFDKNKEEDGKPFTEYRMIQVQKGHSDSGFTEIILPKEVDYKTLKVVIKGAYNLLSAKKNAGEMAC